MATRVKFKTVKSVSKRFRATRRGKVRRNRAYGRHLKACKSPKQRRRSRRAAIVDPSQVRTILRALGAK